MKQNPSHLQATFDRRVKHTRNFSVDYMVLADRSPAPKRRRELASAEEDPSVKLRPRKSGPYRVVRPVPHTVTVGIDGLHNVAAIDRVTLSQASQKVNQDASVRNCDNHIWTEYGTTLAKPHTGKSAMEKKANIVPKMTIYHRPHKKMQSARNSVNNLHVQVEKKKNNQRKMLSIESSTAESTGNVRYITCVDMATGPMTIHYSRQNICRNNLLVRFEKRSSKTGRKTQR